MFIVALVKAIYVPNEKDTQFNHLAVKGAEWRVTQNKQTKESHSDASSGGKKSLNGIGKCQLKNKKFVDTFEANVINRYASILDRCFGIEKHQFAQFLIRSRARFGSARKARSYFHFEAGLKP